MEDPNFRLKIMLAIELPFWLNLRIGYYPIEYDEHVIYQLHIDCLKWEISTVNDPRNPSRQENYVQIQEDAKNNVVVNKESEQAINDAFPGGPVNFRKMTSVVSTSYYLCKNSEFNDHQIVDLVIEKKEHLFLLINKFISAYMGYFSTKDFNHEAHLLSIEYLRRSVVRYWIVLNDLDISNRVNVPQYFNPKFFPELFPKFEQDNKFIELMKRGILPSFCRQSIGHSNHFRKNGDWRMGIIFLDIALESCINEFIEKYNQDFEEEKLREIGEKYNEYGCKKMWSVGDFLKRDLKQLSEKLNSKSYFQDINDTVRDVKELHSRRNVIIHNRCRKESDRDDEIICTTIKLLNCLEDYIGREKVTNNLDDEFAPNPVAVTLSASDSRGYVYVRPYKSFTEATRPVADKKK